MDKLSILGIPIIIHRGPSGGVEIDKNYIKWAISSKSGLDEDTKKFIESYLEL